MRKWLEDQPTCVECQVLPSLCSHYIYQVKTDKRDCKKRGDVRGCSQFVIPFLYQMPATIAQEQEPQDKVSEPMGPEWYEFLLDQGWLPDAVLREGIRFLLASRLTQLTRQPPQEQLAQKMDFIRALKQTPKLAIHTEKANEQHYEVPTEFLQMCLGRHMKYSCCWFDPVRNPSRDLDAAEEAMLEIYCQRAQLKDGHAMLDLGCGWGSLSLYLAEKYPQSRVTALSNSRTQKQYIDARARELGLDNLTVVTDDISTFDTTQRFDRILSIEMFEHVKNYQGLFQKISTWLKDDSSRLFVHIFAHRSMPYHFETNERHSWMARYFFTGGTMPSDDLFLFFQEDLTCLDHWIVNGTHYAQTSEAWLKLLDNNTVNALQILKKAYGNDQEARTWLNRWRVFYLSCAELFNFQQGSEWFVSHYLFKKNRNLTGGKK